MIQYFDLEMLNCLPQIVVDVIECIVSIKGRCSAVHSFSLKNKTKSLKSRERGELKLKR